MSSEHTLRFDSILAETLRKHWRVNLDLTGSIFATLGGPAAQLTAGKDACMLLRQNKGSDMYRKLLQSLTAIRPASLHIQPGMTVDGQLQLLARNLLTTWYRLAGLPSKHALEVEQPVDSSLSAVAPKGTSCYVTCAWQGKALQEQRKRCSTTGAAVTTCSW